MRKKKRILIPVRIDESDVQWMDELIDKRKYDTRAQIIRRAVYEFLEKHHQEKILA